MHHNLLESVRKMTGIESDATTLDNLQTKFKDLDIEVRSKTVFFSPFVNKSCRTKKRVLEQQNVPHGNKVLCSRQDRG